MKRKLALGLTGIMMISALTGCGQSSSKYLLNVKYSKYVKLCEYKGIDAEKVTVEVTEEEIQEMIDSNMYEFATYDPITDRGIEVGDNAKIDYTATLDGKESEDYSGEEEEIVVGEGYLYPELEDALIGKKTGESGQVEVELTEDYADEGDIGKKLSVDFKVDEITVEVLPEYNEEFVKENTDYDSMKDYEASIAEELKENKEETYKAETIDDMMNYLIDNSKFNGYPDELYQQCEEDYDNSNAYNAAMYGMELEDYLEFMGIDEDTRKADIEGSVNYELVIGAIAQKENIDCTDDEIKKFVKDIYEDYGYESEDEFLADYTEDEIGYAIIYEKVIDLLYENANFTEISEEEYQERYEDELDDEEEFEIEEEDDDTEAVDDTEAKTDEDASADTETKTDEVTSADTETKTDEATSSDTETRTDEETSVDTEESTTEK